MAKIRCEKCQKDLDGVVQRYDVYMKYDAKEEDYLKEKGKGQLSTNCPDCGEMLEEL